MTAAGAPPRVRTYIYNQGRPLGQALQEAW
jgi:hypothetical protein